MPVPLVAFNFALSGSECDVGEEAVLRLVEPPQVLQQAEGVLVLGPHPALHVPHHHQQLFSTSLFLAWGNTALKFNTSYLLKQVVCITF